MKLGTRKSRLALKQAQIVKEKLERKDFKIKLEEIETSGDRRKEWKNLQEISGNGVFTKEINKALIAGKIDLAVHSLKDLPTDIPGELKIAAIPPRASVNDVLIGKKLEDLKEGDKVGTGSPRRKSQLTNQKPKVKVKNIRGNIETRINKVGKEVDAVILSKAGIDRIDMEDKITQILPLKSFLPAPGQGALAVMTRSKGKTKNLVKSIDDEETSKSTEAERYILKELGTGCMEPIGAYAFVENKKMVLKAGNFRSGSYVEGKGNLNEAKKLGKKAATSLKGNSK